jgi:hypothetical protein
MFYYAETHLNKETFRASWLMHRDVKTTQTVGGSQWSGKKNIWT